MKCPICGEELGMYDEVFIYKWGDEPAGCTQCLRRYDATDWLTQQADEAIWHSQQC